MVYLPDYDLALAKLLCAGVDVWLNTPQKLGSDGPVVVAYDRSLQASRALQAFQALGLYGQEEVPIIAVAEDHVEAVRYADRAAEFLRFHEVPARAGGRR